MVGDTRAPCHAILYLILVVRGWFQSSGPHLVDVISDGWSGVIYGWVSLERWIVAGYGFKLASITRLVWTYVFWMRKVLGLVWVAKNILKYR